jgi:hypothetical protein
MQITVLPEVPLLRIMSWYSARLRGEPVRQPPHVRANARPLVPTAGAIRSKVSSQSSQDPGPEARRMT